MKVSLTVRLDTRQLELLVQAARESGRTVSDAVRDALDLALTPRTIDARARRAGRTGRVRVMVGLSRAGGFDCIRRRRTTDSCCVVAESARARGRGAPRQGRKAARAKRVKRWGWGPSALINVDRQEGPNAMK